MSKINNVRHCVALLKFLDSYSFVVMGHYTIIDICWGGHELLLNSKLHTDRREADQYEVFTVR